MNYLKNSWEKGYIVIEVIGTKPTLGCVYMKTFLKVPVTSVPEIDSLSLCLCGNIPNR